MYIFIYFLYLGPCYCKDKQGRQDDNEIMCVTDRNFEQVDRCKDDEGCIGPDSPDKAKLFSKTNFCSKGASCFLTNHLIKFFRRI